MLQADARTRVVPFFKDIRTEKKLVATARATRLLARTSVFPTFLPPLRAVRNGPPTALWPVPSPNLGSPCVFVLLAGLPSERCTIRGELGHRLVGQFRRHTRIGSQNDGFNGHPPSSHPLQHPPHFSPPSNPSPTLAAPPFSGRCGEDVGVKAADGMSNMDQVASSAAYRAENSLIQRLLALSTPITRRNGRGGRAQRLGYRALDERNGQLIAS